MRAFIQAQSPAVVYGFKYRRRTFNDCNFFVHSAANIPQKGLSKPCEWMTITLRSYKDFGHPFLSKLQTITMIVYAVPTRAFLRILLRRENRHFVSETIQGNFIIIKLTRCLCLRSDFLIGILDLLCIPTRLASTTSNPSLAAVVWPQSIWGTILALNA